jgi:uncharacterized membrane protein
MYLTEERMTALEDIARRQRHLSLLFTLFVVVFAMMLMLLVVWVYAYVRAPENDQGNDSSELMMSNAVDVTIS